MASIKGIALKKVKTFIGREGEGVTADIYIDGKMVGRYADYADGSLYPDIDIDSEWQDTFDTRIKEYFAKHTPLLLEEDKTVRYVRLIEESETWTQFYERIDDVWEEHATDDMGFFEVLLALADEEKTFKKYVKKGYKHCVAITDAVVNNMESEPVVFVTRSEGKALQELIDRTVKEGKYIRPKVAIYSSLEDFKIK